MNNFSHEGLSWVQKSAVGTEPMSEKAAELTFDPQARRGVTVVTHGYFAGDPNSGKLMEHGEKLYWNESSGDYPDKAYPVDVKLGEENFYGDDDFVGKYGGNTFVFLGGVGNGFMEGYMKGYGFVQYSTEFSGAGLALGKSGGTITGKFLGTSEERLP